MVPRFSSVYESNWSISSKATSYCLVLSEIGYVLYSTDPCLLIFGGTILKSEVKGIGSYLDIGYIPCHTKPVA